MNDLPTAPMTPLGARTPHSHPALYGVIAGLALIILAGVYLVWADLGGYWPYPPLSSSSEVPPYVFTPTPTPTATPSTGAVYRNATYGLMIRLPDDWKGFTTVPKNWQAWEVSTGNMVATGPEVVLRHPLWTAAKPYEDLPIMVFTTAQWQKVKGPNDVIWTVSAAPFPPAPLASNSNYVFALPPRYNYDFAQGFQALDDAVHAGAVSAF